MKKLINTINNKTNETVIIGTTKGGIGKSILTYNIAVTLQNIGINVRIADIDFQQTIFITNFQRQKKKKEALNVKAIKSINELELFLNEDFKGITLIDIGGFDNSLNRFALEQAKKIIIPFSGSPLEKIGLLPFRKILEECKINKEIVSIFLNKIHPNKTKLDSIKNGIINTFPNFLKTVIRTSSDFDNQLSKGLAVSELKIKTVKGEKVEPKSKLQINDLTNEIIKLVGA